MAAGLIEAAGGDAKAAKREADALVAKVVLDPRFNGPKLVDAFGPDGSHYITIPIGNSRVFTNNDFSTHIEGPGDVLLVPDRVPANAPNLDIVDWQIEVRLQ